MATTVKKKRTTNYLSNKNLMEQFLLSCEKDQMTDELAKMFILLCERIAQRGNFVNYTYIDDMKGFGLLTLVKTWRSFNPEKSNNCFAYYTQIVKNAFVQYLKIEKNQRNIRDKMLLDSGQAPSHTFIADMEREEELKKEATDKVE